MNTRILIVEDSASLRKLLCQALQQRGFQIYEAWSLASARRLLPSVHPSVILLDLGLEGEDGYEFLIESVAARIPTIIVSARERASERVRSLMLGAADYVVKPADFDELVLRIQRAERLGAATQPVMSLVESGKFRIDLVNRRIMADEGATDPLSPHEFQLVLLMVQWRGRTVTREEIATSVLGRVSLAEGRSIDVLVSKLRKKLETVGGGHLIETDRGQGYRLTTIEK